MSNNIGYDELLMDRVKQLREIDERLEAMLIVPPQVQPDILHKALRDLRADLALMIQHAEEEWEAF